jgi:hypothetical protein
VRDSLLFNSIPEVQWIFSGSQTSLYIPTLIAGKSHEIVQISCFRTTCLLNVLCGEFYINVNVILTSKIKHFEERQVAYPSHNAYHTARMNICINKEIRLPQQSEHRSAKELSLQNNLTGEIFLKISCLDNFNPLKCINELATLI